MTVEDNPRLIEARRRNQRRDGWPRSLMVMTFGAWAWLAASAGLAFSRSGTKLITPAILIVVGLLLIRHRLGAGPAQGAGASRALAC